MTISTPPTSWPARAFTLVEVLVAATLTVFVLAGVLGAFVFLTQSGLRASGYGELEAEVRRGLEMFARDTRNATDVRWNNSQSVTLTVSGAPVTYAYDHDPASPTHRSFFRVSGDAASAQPRLVLIHQVEPEFSFRRFKLASAGGDDSAANDRETKQLQVHLRAVRSNQPAPGASHSAVSARYVLRNKRVTN